MASVPNMRLGPAQQPGSPGQAAEGAEGDLFAQLLSSFPIALGQMPAEEGGEGEAPEAGEAETEAASAEAELGIAVPEIPVPVIFAPLAASIVNGPAGAGQPPAEVAPQAGPGPVAEAAPLAPSPLPNLAAAVRDAQPPAPAAATTALSLAAAEENAAPAQRSSDPDAGREAPLRRAEVTDQKIVAMLRGLSAPTAPRQLRETSAPAKAAAAIEGTAPASAAPQPQLQVATAPAAPAFVTVQTALRAENPMPPPTDAATQMVERQLDLAADGEWLDTLARDIARAGGSEGPMRFRLNPEHLGALRIEVSQGDDGASIRVVAETEAARAILADAQPKLVAEARAQGLRLAEAHVDLAGGQAGDPRRQDDGRREAAVRTAGDIREEAEPAGDGPRGTSDRYA